MSTLRTSISRAALAVILALAGAAAPLAAFTQEVYVWQRRGGEEVAASLREFAPRCDGFNVLAAEVSWAGGQPRVTRTTPDFALLAGLGRPVGLSLRVGVHPGPFAEDDATARALATRAAELLATARRHGLEPAELQIDFDCAEAKLPGYRAWLAALRRAVAPVPLVFTALPAWLDRRDAFAALAAATDGFVLQVHSLERPAGPDAPFTLCDPVRAAAWVRQADRFGRPFRVALPTYGYTLAFDAGGKFLGLAAEGAAPPWPADAQRRIVRADPVALAGLARELRTRPPEHCTGLLWFRLPVAGDRLNWPAATLAAVLRGEAPRSALTVEVRWPQPGLAEIVVRNTGETSEPPPAALTLRWTTSDRPSAADGLAGYQLAPESTGRWRAVNNFSSRALLRPGGSTTVAWLRFAHEIPLQVEVVEKQ